MRLGPSCAINTQLERAILHMSRHLLPQYFHCSLFVCFALQACVL
jgi:hypothetical protein